MKFFNILIKSLTWSWKCTMAMFLAGRQKSLWTFPKRLKCFSKISFLLRAAGTFLHWRTDESVGDMPLRLSELSLRTFRFTGVTVPGAASPFSPLGVIQRKGKSLDWSLILFCRRPTKNIQCHSWGRDQWFDCQNPKERQSSKLQQLARHRIAVDTIRSLLQNRAKLNWHPTETGTGRVQERKRMHWADIHIKEHQRAMLGMEQSTIHQFHRLSDSFRQVTSKHPAESYGVPPQMTALIKMFYHQFKCSVIVNGNLTEKFLAESGVHQGCIISPMLFLTAIDWTKWRTIADKPRGIYWTLFTQLEDLDYADDLAALSTNHTHLQEKTNQMDTFAKQIGLNINSSKTQVMCRN